MIAGDALGAMTFTGIFVGGLNRQTYFANAACRVETFFMTPELSKQDDRVLFLPLCYADILGHLRRTKIDAALFSVAPPDANGLCRSEEHTSELQSLMRISYAVFCLKKKKNNTH